MININKKKIRINENNYIFLSYEELIEKYKPFIQKKVYSWTKHLKQKFYIHQAEFEYDDIYQLALIGIYKAFNNYDIDRDIAIYNYMEKNIDGEILRYSRDTTKLRRKGENAYDFKYTYLDDSFSVKTDSSDINVSELIEDKNNPIENFIEANYMENLLSILTKEEQYFINERFIKQTSQVDLAKKLGRNQGYISRTEKKILEKLRNQGNEPKQITKTKKEIFNMKLNIEDVIKYLKDNARPDRSAYSVIKDYAKINNIAPTTIYTALTRHREEEYEKIKLLYKQGKIFNPKQKEKIESLKEKLETNNIVPVPIPVELEAPQLTTFPENLPGLVVESPKTTEVLINPFKDVVIKNMTIEFADFYAEFLNNGVEINLKNKSINDFNKEVKCLNTIDDIEDFIKDLEKVKNIMKVMF